MTSIDLVIPCYNYGHFLGDCIDSVLAQGVGEMRILIIDNASTDNSVEIARRYAAKDPRIEVRARERNLGPQASFNEGVDWAASDYFVMLHADDLLAPDALKSAVAVMEQHPNVSFAFGKDFLFLQEQRAGLHLDQANGSPAAWKILTGRQFVRRIQLQQLATVAPVVRTSAQKRAGHFHPDLPFTDDVEMLMRLACFGDIAQTASSLALQRLHGTNISRSLWEDPIARLVQEDATIETFYGNEGRCFGRKLHRRARRDVGKRAYWAAVSQLLQGRIDKAKELLKFAYARCPSALIVPPVDYLLHGDKPFGRMTKGLWTFWETKTRNVGT